MAYARLLIASAAILLSVSACSTGHYGNKIQGSYGSSYKNGIFATKARKYDEAADHFAFAAKSGHPRALIAYGDLFVSGRGVERDPLRAQALYEEAYSKSSNYRNKAAFVLGRLLIDGGDGPSGTLEPDHERARLLLTQALEGGETRAAGSLGRIYEHGLGTLPDVDRAIDYYEQVAAGNAMAARSLAHLLAETGASERRVAAAAAKAVSQLEQQAKSGKSRAWIQLADIFTRDQIIDPDPKRAIGYLENVADDDNPAALLRLAALYGQIGDRSQERSILRRAADKGDMKAQTQLARLFLKANTTDTNGPVGRYYAERAIAQGSEAAMVYLGIALVRGEVLEPDPDIGEVLLRRASNAGYMAGSTALGIAILRNQISPRVPGEGLQLLETAAEEGSKAAMSALGFAYHTGRGLPKNDALARQWLQRAADAGHPKAQRFLSEQTGA